jgi:hypothetical protein
VIQAAMPSVYLKTMRHQDGIVRADGNRRQGNVLTLGARRIANPPQVANHTCPN